MFNFFKQIFSTKDGSHTVVVISDDGSKQSTSHRISPVNLWLVLFGLIGGVTGLVIFLIMFTPLGKLVYDEENVRESVITIQQKVAALQDTLEARNMQLRQIQQVMAAGKDTSFSVSSSLQSTDADQGRSTSQSEDVTQQSGQVNRIPPDAVLISNLFQRSPDFPASYPLDGTPTRLFNSSIGHYGLDIAAKAGTAFRAVADGVILNQEWTINYGYVIVIQHSEEVISIYKHASGVEKKIGESVQKGDVLGTIGDIGVLSSGPHLHIEIWERGVPQNPQNYLVNS